MIISALFSVVRRVSRWNPMILGAWGLSLLLLFSTGNPYFSSD
jgi:hypothetical protein